MLGIAELNSLLSQHSSEVINVRQTCLVVQTNFGLDGGLVSLDTCRLPRPFKLFCILHGAEVCSGEQDSEDCQSAKSSFLGKDNLNVFVMLPVRCFRMSVATARFWPNTKSAGLRLVFRIFALFS